MGVLPLLEAILQVMPLDRSVPHAILRAAAGNDPAQADPIHRQIDACCAALAPGFAPVPLDGEALYPRIRAAPYDRRHQRNRAVRQCHPAQGRDCAATDGPG